MRDWADRLMIGKAARQPADDARISELQAPDRKERDVYVYFDNDVDGHAPRDAERLTELVGRA